jgi:hypothetical protein
MAKEKPPGDMPPGAQDCLDQLQAIWEHREPDDRRDLPRARDSGILGDKLKRIIRKAGLPWMEWRPKYIPGRQQWQLSLDMRIAKHWGELKERAGEEGLKFPDEVGVRDAQRWLAKGRPRGRQLSEKEKARRKAEGAVGAILGLSPKRRAKAIEELVAASPSKELARGLLDRLGEQDRAAVVHGIWDQDDAVRSGCQQIEAEMEAARLSCLDPVEYIREVVPSLDEAERKKVREEVEEVLGEAEDDEELVKRLVQEMGPEEKRRTFYDLLGDEQVRGAAEDVLEQEGKRGKDGPTWDVTLRIKGRMAAVEGWTPGQMQEELAVGDLALMVRDYPFEVLEAHVQEADHARKGVAPATSVEPSSDGTSGP